ncbi:betaine/proline/choline family ABC transporter ATP-binding protein [Psychromonas sp. 14N.309.X.WAT.B.A12]|uniref:quaternary amine ABC transporter ATP-binding protein n=1 Tax=Psychromonas sp. 14N.309.X.WAT.B.A12 TaxID=2998322 RepID=UPI0025B1B28F|nr:betaine/proline/choline family ABC transporter ATP-binding protein [Psychromonas sp. 14N.309.X.WAT.B.A12]MDN2664579.1 betaine/proline/choline family ABC transporter ATP-binding protein [Psychromonas sp. 14N.309.X.WAT.B.A12]
MTTDVIQLENVWKIFGDRAEEAMEAVKSEGLDKATVLERFGCVVGIADVSFKVARSEIFCIMGLSGSGKSTLIRHLNRLIEPSAGLVKVLDQDMSALSPNALRETRAKDIGMVFQHMALLPHRTVADNVAFPLEVQGLPKAQRWETSLHALSLVNLTGYEYRLPHQLSGGMQQRVGLARALASDPEVLLMDEPFSALDPLIRHELQNQFVQLTKNLQKTTVFITHDLDEAIRIGDRIAIMKDGCLIQIGTPEEIVMQPADEYVADFVKGISNLKLINAHSIMLAINDTTLPSSIDKTAALRADENTSLEALIDLSVTTTLPIIVTNDTGQDIGVISKDTLLKGIKGEE